MLFEKQRPIQAKCSARLSSASTIVGNILLALIRKYSVLPECCQI